MVTNDFGFQCTYDRNTLDSVFFISEGEAITVLLLLLFLVLVLLQRKWNYVQSNHLVK